MSKEDKELVVVKLQSASLDDRDGDIVAHGWLDIDAIQNLRVGDYQREILESRGKKSTLRTAVETGERLPDIMLGMRGQRYTSRGQTMVLEDDVFIIDGLQRVSALRKFAADNPEEAKKLRIGAEIRFGTTRDSETALFTTVNVKRKAMAPSVILRNQRNHSTGVATLYGLSMNDKNFSMFNKVCWDQQMHRGEILTAMTFAKVCITLHRQFAPGGRFISSVSLLPRVADTMSSVAGLQNFRANIATFFEMMDAVWGIRGIKYTDRLTHTRGNFIVQLAGVLSDHEDFWDGNRLVVDAQTKAKLKSFPIDDPTIMRLAGTGNTAGALLYRYFVDHLNKNKQTSRHLVTRRIEHHHKKNNKK